MNKDIKEDLIEELTKLYIKSYQEDKKGNKVYIERTKFIKDFIKFVKRFF